jgi:hypothetical protein
VKRRRFRQFVGERRLGRFDLLIAEPWGLCNFEVVNRDIVGQPGLPHPVVCGVSHDREDPGSRIAVGETFDAAERAQAGLLDDVLGVRQPSNASRIRDEASNSRGSA